MNENLILNREQIKASEEYRLALDAWNDEVQALKVGIGTGLLPVLTSLLDTMNKNREAARLSFEIYGTSRRNITKDQRDALWEQVNATEAATESTKDLTSANATGDTWWEKSTMQKMQEEAALIALTEAQKAQIAYEKEELGLIQGRSTLSTNLSRSPASKAALPERAYKARL